MISYPGRFGGFSLSMSPESKAENNFGNLYIGPHMKEGRIFLKLITITPYALFSTFSYGHRFLGLEEIVHMPSCMHCFNCWCAAVARKFSQETAIYQPFILGHHLNLRLVLPALNASRLPFARF